jgi:hypothetical protein
VLEAPQLKSVGSDAADPVRGAKRIGVLWLVVAILAYVGLRLAVLQTNFDAVAMPSFELGTIGNLAMVVSEEHGGAPIADHFDNVGGHLVVGLLAAPLYALLGPQYSTLKLVPLALGIGTLILVWRLLSRHFDRRAAILAAFLFAFAPPVLFKYSVIAKGNHFENLVFQLWFLNAFFDMHARGVTRRGLIWTGLSAGCAVFVYTGALLTVASALALHVWVRGARKCLSDAAWAGLTFALGVFPLLWLDVASGGRERQFLRTRFIDNHVPDVGNFASRWRGFWTEILPQSAGFEDAAGIPGKWASVFFVLCFAAAWCVAALAVWRAVRSTPARRTHESERARFEGSKTTIWLLHLPAISLLAAAFDFQFTGYNAPVAIGNYRYLVPHVAWAIVLIAIACSRLRESPNVGWKRFGGVLATGSLATGLFTLPLVHTDGSTTNLGSRYEGFWFESYPNVMFRDREWVVGDMEADVASFDARDAHRVYQGLGFSLAWLVELRGASANGSGEERMHDIVGKFAPDHAIDVARGIGAHLQRGPDSGAQGTERLRAVLVSLDQSSDPFAPYVIEGLALDQKYPLVVSARSFLERGLVLAPLVPERLVGRFFRGLGIACGRELPRDLPIDRSLAAEFALATPALVRDEFFFGLGWGAAETTNSGDRVAALRRAIGSEYVAATWTGFGAACRHDRDSSLRTPLDLTRAEAEWVAQGREWKDYPRSFAIGPRR